ncbi:hypothetical protein MMC13_002415 [Lambiella insularis]|nr:hypothetical protein [Lambiella insularis]
MTSTNEIALNGDVYLILDGAQLRVYSQVLRCASKVWAAMFSPPFSEGTTISQGKPLYLPLPDDDTEAMTTMCNVLHHKYKFDMPTPTTELFETLAVASDKYDCHEAMSQWVGLSLRPRLRAIDRQPGYQKKGIRRLHLPAYHFDDPEVFREVTKLMVYSRHGPSMAHESKSNWLNAYATPGISPAALELLPEVLLPGLTRKEYPLKKDLIRGLEDIIHMLADKPCEPISPEGNYRNGEKAGNQASHHPFWACECNSRRLFYFIKQLSHHDLYSVLKSLDWKSLAGILACLEACDFSVTSAGASYHKVYDAYMHSQEEVGEVCSICKPNLVLEVAQLKERVENAFSGFCLDCVKHGPPRARDPSKGVKCRIVHDGFLGI